MGCKGLHCLWGVILYEHTSVCCAHHVALSKCCTLILKSPHTHIQNPWSMAVEIIAFDVNWYCSLCLCVPYLHVWNERAKACQPQLDACAQDPWRRLRALFPAASRSGVERGKGQKGNSKDDDSGSKKYRAINYQSLTVGCSTVSDIAQLACRALCSGSLPNYSYPIPSPQRHYRRHSWL